MLPGAVKRTRQSPFWGPPGSRSAPTDLGGALSAGAGQAAGRRLNSSGFIASCCVASAPWLGTVQQCPAGDTALHRARNGAADSIDVHTATSPASARSVPPVSVSGADDLPERAPAAPFTARCRPPASQEPSSQRGGHRILRRRRPLARAKLVAQLPAPPS